jgi:hypothetical protein
LRKALMVLLCASLVAGCERSKTEILQRRLDHFRDLLPLELREEFDSKNYKAVAQGIDTLLQQDAEFKESYDKMRHQELIDVFSPQEVVDYFREHFVEEIEKLKTSKQSPR